MLTTPDNIGTNIKKRLAFSGVSPDVVRGAGVNPDKSIADITDNWRSRASENGIKVAFGSQDNSNYAADDCTCIYALLSRHSHANAPHIASDMSLSDIANDSAILAAEEGV